MNLYDFEEAVSSTIVDRGFEYYEAGFVAELARVGNRRYTAVVKGADMYEIAVELDEEGNILSSYCDCPYIMGMVCKHEVAVYYELIDRLKDEDFPKEASELDLKVILENLSKEKLVDILIDLAENDPVLHNGLLFNYSVYDDVKWEIDRCKRLVDAIIEKYSGRDGFITYKNVGDFTEELTGVLHKTERLNDPLISFEIARMLLSEGMKAFQYADDSNGDIGYLIDVTIKKMSAIAHETLEWNEQTELLDKLIHLSKSDIFEGWDDFRIDVLAICMEFAGNEQMRKRLMNELETMIEDSSANDYGRYANERIHNLMYDIIESYGTTEEARQFLQENLNYPTFRKRLMQYEMKAGNFENVLALASEGERLDKDYRGLVARWKKWRYKAYRHLKSIEEQMKIGRELLIEGEFEFYWELKDLVSEKKAFYEEMKQELAVKNKLMFVKLIEAENDVDSILEYVRENPSLVEHYWKYLVGSHKEEAIRLFEYKVKVAAENSFNRKEYIQVCQLLKRFGKLAGREVQMKVAGELEQTYKNRPAFLDELAKL
ncbi:SWIM zinc finger family protein [Sporosarcina koreensis]|uniref:SWIM zinc finger domain-containing protein n=1 Tax=Sporosarcina koreensis TaxID=334735 RepID=A0ABW0U0K3_9BACL